MDAQNLEKELAGVFTEGWTVTATGTGFLVATDWLWPNGNAIEIYARHVGESETLFLVTDGGELFNCLFLEGLDFTQDAPTLRVVEQMAQNHGTKLVEYQLAKGAGEATLARSIREMLETVKEISFYLWHRVGEGASTTH